MTGVTLNPEYNVGAIDIESDPKATPYSYAHYKLDEGGGDILIDSIGGHNMIWDTTGANATAADWGGWSDDGLVFGAAEATNHFYVTDPDSFPYEDPTITSIYVVSFTRTSALSASASLFGATGNVAGQNGPNIVIRSSDDKLIGQIRNGTGNVATAIPATATPLNERSTFLMAFSAVENKHYGVFATDSAVVQWEQTNGATPSEVLTDYKLSTACIGGRSHEISFADVINNVTVHNLRFYHDINGGALPNNLGDICRWLHQNKTANIPAVWWS